MYKWRIYYDNGETFDNTMGEPEQAPGYGVICVLQITEDTGRMTNHRWDFYYWENGFGWIGSDVHGLMDRLCHDTENKVRGVKQGRTVKNHVYAEIMMRASKDTDFPQQSATTLIENPRLLTEQRKG